MADPEPQLDYLHRQIAERLARLESSAAWYRKLYVRGQMTTIVLSAIITIVAGLKSLSLVGSVASDLVLVLGALVMTAAAWAALFSPRESWHLNAATYTELRALQARLEFVERGSAFGQRQDQVLEDVFAEYQAIVGAYNRHWQELRLKAK
jgi:hypothetical protein